MWFYLALLTAIISAFSVIIYKSLLKGVRASVLTWTTLVLATPIIFILSLKDGIPELNSLFFVGITGSVLFYTISKILGFKAIRIANLSEVYPLVSVAPIFTLLFATLSPLNEIPSKLAVLGVLISLSGVYILNIENIKGGILRPIKLLFQNQASLLMITSIVIDSVVIVFDKIAINNTIPKNTNFTLLAENLMVIVGMLPILYIRNKNFINQIFVNFKLFLIVGLLNAITTILAFSAIGGGNVALVSTILKSQIIFVLLFSFILFKDKPKIQTIIGSIVIIVGVVLIKIGA